MRRRHTYRRIEKTEEINVVHVALHLSLGAKNRLTFPNQQSPSNCTWEMMVSWTQQFILDKICHFSPLSPWWKNMEKITLGVLAWLPPNQKKKLQKFLTNFGPLPCFFEVRWRWATYRTFRGGADLSFAPWRWKTVKSTLQGTSSRWVGWGRLEISKSTIRYEFFFAGTQITNF